MKVIKIAKLIGLRTQTKMNKTVSAMRSARYISRDFGTATPQNGRAATHNYLCVTPNP